MGIIGIMILITLLQHIHDKGINPFLNKPLFQLGNSDNDVGCVFVTEVVKLKTFSIIASLS